MIVDDDPLLREIAADFLEEIGYRSTDSVSAVEAQRILAVRSDVDFIVTDIWMPGGMNGLQLAAHVAESYPHIGIVITSGIDRDLPGELPEKTAFLRKPYSQEDLAKALKPRAV